PTQERTDMSAHLGEKMDAAGKDVTSAIYGALRDTDIAFAALSTNGISIFGDRKSIDAINSALNRDAQFDGICTNLRHWQEECGKLHARLAEATTALK